MDMSVTEICQIKTLLTICPCLAIFLMSAIIFFSCCSSLWRSLSRSRMALFSALWFCLSISSGVFLLPNRNSIWHGQYKREKKDQIVRCLKENFKEGFPQSDKLSEQHYRQMIMSQKGIHIPMTLGHVMLWHHSLQVCHKVNKWFLKLLSN